MTGDAGVAVHTAMYSTGDTLSTKNAVQSIYDRQQSDGELNYNGPPLNFGGSDTYFLWGLNAYTDYYTYSNDKEWAEQYWPRFLKGMKYAISKVII